MAKPLGTFPAVRQLSPAELATYKSSFVAGWAIPGLVNDQGLDLRVLVPPDSPFGRPRIAVYPAPPLFSWPHLEEHGLLCLLPSSSTHQLARPGDLAVTLLNEARILVNECLNGSNHEDFELEFESYWSRWSRTTATVISMCRHDGATREIVVWKSIRGAIVADSSEELERWVRNRYSVVPRELSIQTVPLVRLDRPPRPQSYPGNLGELLLLVGRKNADFIRAAILKNSADIVICIANTTRGYVTFGFRFDLSNKTTRRGGNQRESGFRPGTMPDEIRMMRIGSLPLQGAVVNRYDANWIHGRDKNLLSDKLINRHVVIFGLGSVGSGIARLLAQSGVGTLDLVDPELLHSENISRHELGAGSADLKKASEMAAAMRQRFPHLKISAFDVDIFTFANKHPEKFADADLVISATGDWAADAWLNAAAIEHRSGPG